MKVNYFAVSHHQNLKVVIYINLKLHLNSPNGTIHQSRRHRGAAGAAAPQLPAGPHFYGICRNANFETKSNCHFMYLKSVRGPCSDRGPGSGRETWCVRGSSWVRGPWLVRGPWSAREPWSTREQLSVRGSWSARGPWSVRRPWSVSGPWSARRPWSVSGPWSARGS